MNNNVAFRSTGKADHLATLKGCGMFDAARDQALDALTLLTSCICDTSVSAINLDAGRQWFQSTVSHRDLLREMSQRFFQGENVAA